MAKSLLIPLCVILLAAPGISPAGDTDNEALTYGFVCRIVSSRSLAVITPLQGVFSLGSRVLFHDDTGAICATGVVSSTYPDLAYVAVDNGAMEILSRGFIASSADSEEIRVICRYSMNIPMVIEKGVRPGHVVPPNVVVINYIENTMRPVYFRHYAHDLGCRTCHHKDLDTPCKSCHPVRNGDDKVPFADCVRQRCMGCHEGHRGKSAECVWCHR